MNLIKKISKICILSSFLITLNTATAMTTKMDDVKLPDFVCASDKTKIVLSGYTQAACQDLFESNFPVSNFDDIVQAVNSIKEIRDFAFSPGLTSDVQLKMEEILCNLIVYLRHKINEKQAVLLPEIKADSQNLSVEQKDILEVVCKKHGSIMCLLGTAACGFATVAIAVALFSSDNYPVQNCFK